jgi:TrmH family RNA methyltransferase
VVRSSANLAVKAARKLAGRRGRRDADELLVEGQAVAEALPFLRRLFVAEDASDAERALADQAAARGCRVTTVTRAVLDSVTDTVTPQGLVGLAALPRAEVGQVLAGASLVVVAWRVRDPGNLGALIRCADAAGADAVIVTADSVDPGNPKAVRASTGSVFHLPVVTGCGFAEVVAACRAAGLRLVAADAAGPVPVADVDLVCPVALVFGNEAHGLDPGVAAACDVVVRIPLHAGPRPGFHRGAESLNLAAAVAIVTYEAARQRAGARS